MTTTYTQRDEPDAWFIDIHQDDDTFSMHFSSPLNRDVAWESLIEEQESGEVFV